MSIDIDWKTLTAGPDGEALAENIRSFIHDKFQQTELPRFIRSVQVHSFDFGTISPDLEIKDICDPLPDFYEDDGDDDDDDDTDSEEADERAREERDDRQLRNFETQLQTQQSAGVGGRESMRGSIQMPPPQLHLRLPAMRTPLGLSDHLGSPFMRSATPGIPGGTSNMSYFHLPLGHLSGTQTPLAAVAGGGTPFSTNGGWPGAAPPPRDPLRDISGESNPYNSHEHQTIDHNSPNSRPSTANTLHSQIYSHSSHHQNPFINPPSINLEPTPRSPSPPLVPRREPRPTDLQIVTSVKYAGNIQLSLTAEILIDYPMPSFVGIPLKLNITGLTFDGVAILAYIRHRAHFCFLAPEDAEAMVGTPSAANEGGGDGSSGVRVGKKGNERGLLQEIRVESEIGRKEGGKQVLKNVGKVEKFVLEQVRRIFEDEFVWPSFWTFLV